MALCGMPAWACITHSYHTDTVSWSVDARVPVDHTSVGLAQARPNKTVEDPKFAYTCQWTKVPHPQLVPGIYARPSVYLTIPLNLYPVFINKAGVYSREAPIQVVSSVIFSIIIPVLKSSKACSRSHCSLKWEDQSYPCVNVYNTEHVYYHVVTWIPYKVKLWKQSQFLKLYGIILSKHQLAVISPGKVVVKVGLPLLFNLKHIHD